jgi:hypothetical protein
MPLRFLGLECPTAARPTEAGFPELHEELGVRTACSAGVDASVEVGRCLHVFMPEQLPY